MSRTTKIVSINAPAEKVLEYISVVENHPAFIPPLKSVGNLQGDEKNPGTVWDWVFVMAGIELKGKSETVEHQPGKLFKYKTYGEIESVFTYSVESEGEGCRLTMDVEYSIPESVLGKANQAIVEKINSESAEAAEENIKAILEG